MTFEVLMLVCSLARTPDAADCNESTAVDVMKEKRDFSSAHSCYVYAVYKTQPLLEKDETFSKIRCRGERDT
jgi:hypothetical protein